MFSQITTALKHGKIFAFFMHSQNKVFTQFGNIFCNFHYLGQCANSKSHTVNLNSASEKHNYLFDVINKYILTH